MLRSHKVFSSILIILLGLTFITHVWHDRLLANIKDNINVEQNNKYIKLIKTFDILVLKIFIILTIIGVVLYIGQKKLDYEDSFEWKTFFIGNTTCAGTTNELSDKAPLTDLLKAAFTSTENIINVKEDIKLRMYSN